MRVSLVSVAVVAALLTACGDDDAPPEEAPASAIDATAPKFKDPTAIAEALRDAGFGCRDFAMVDDKQTEQGQCLVDGDVSTFIAHFIDAEDQADYLDFGATVGCDELATQGSAGRVHYVNGNLWTIEPSSDQKLVDRIAAKIGGTAAVIDCTKQPEKDGK